MRNAVGAVFFAVLLYPAQASAQSCEPGRWMVGLERPDVVVTMTDGKTLKGVLVCIDEDVVHLVEGARFRRVLTRDVRRIVKPRDRLWNGVLFGALTGAYLASSSYGEAKYGGAEEGPYILNGMAVCAAIGAAIDALHGSSLTIYAAPARSSSHISPATLRGRALGLGWRIRF
jgi:hypothetical protein